MSEATTLNTLAIAIGNCLAARGCDVPRLFRDAGIDPALLGDPGGRHPAAQMTKLWEVAVRETGDVCLGLEAAAFVQPATFHGLGLALLASESLLDALRRSARYSRIVSNAAHVVIEESARGVKEVFHFRADVPVAHESVDMLMATAVSFGRLLMGGEGGPLEVKMRRPLPRPAAAAARAFEACFGCPVRFGAREDSILIDRALALRPLPMANPGLARSNDRVVIDYLAQLDGARVSEKVRAEIIARLPAGEPPRAVVARALKLGDKTLQRRLAEEGTSYRATLDDVRRELAVQYVRQRDLPLSEIAFRLGFADQSAFTRACRRWTGRSPGELRAGP